jgi:hypothetical protein
MHTCVGQPLQHGCLQVTDIPPGHQSSQVQDSPTTNTQAIVCTDLPHPPHPPPALCLLCLTCQLLAHFFGKVHAPQVQPVGPHKLLAEASTSPQLVQRQQQQVVTLDLHTQQHRQHHKLSKPSRQPPLRLARACGANTDWQEPVRPTRTGKSLWGQHGTSFD